AGADASSAGMVDAGFENQKELTKMQLDNQKEIAEMQNETQKEIAGIQSATSRQNTKDQVYAQNEMLAYQQKESTARVASIMENTNLSKQRQVSEIMRQMLTQAQAAGQYFTNDQIKEMTRKVSAEVDLVISKRRISGMALLILALLQRIFLMSSLMLLLVWLIFFMVLIKLLPILGRSEERFSRNAETDLVCRLLLEKKKGGGEGGPQPRHPAVTPPRSLCFLCQSSGHHRDLHSFPTRRSSDLSANAESAVWLFSYWRYCKGYF